MKKLLIPLVLLVVGIGGGVGAGLALAPAPAAPAGDPAAPEAEHAAPADDHAVPADDEHATADEHAAPADEHAAPAADDHAEAPAAPAVDAHGEPATGYEYVRLNNQFVVPVVDEGHVAALVLLSLSVEVVAGQQEAVLLIEPKIRDSFLQVLFDHANTGGFEGMFTAASAMRTLRAALLAAAQDAAGDLVTDVLIVELVRQDQ